MLAPRGIMVFLDDHFLNLWDFGVIFDPGIFVFSGDRFFEFLGSPRNHKTPPNTDSHTPAPDRGGPVACLGGPPY